MSSPLGPLAQSSTMSSTRSTETVHNDRPKRNLRSCLMSELNLSNSPRMTTRPCRMARVSAMCRQVFAHRRAAILSIDFRSPNPNRERPI
jgi:hypothetical protein